MDDRQTICGCTGRKRVDIKKLQVGLSVEKMVVHAPLLRWYVDLGVVMKAVHRSQYFDCSKTFPVTPWAVILTCKAFFYLNFVYEW